MVVLLDYDRVFVSCGICHRFWLFLHFLYPVLRLWDTAAPLSQSIQEKLCVSIRLFVGIYVYALHFFSIYACYLVSSLLFFYREGV